MIDIKGLDKAAVFAALYNRAQPLGMGRLQFIPGDMGIEQAREALTTQSRGASLKGSGISYSPSLDHYYDYVHGRLMKVSLEEDTLEERLYDRDNGTGAALEALKTAGLVP